MKLKKLFLASIAGAVVPSIGGAESEIVYSTELIVRPVGCQKPFNLWSEVARSEKPKKTVRFKEDLVTVEWGGDYSFAYRGLLGGTGRRVSNYLDANIEHEEDRVVRGFLGCNVASLCKNVAYQFRTFELNFAAGLVAKTDESYIRILSGKPEGIDLLKSALRVYGLAPLSENYKQYLYGLLKDCLNFEEDFKAIGLGKEWVQLKKIGPKNVLTQRELARKLCEGYCRIVGMEQDLMLLREEVAQKRETAAQKYEKIQAMNLSYEVD